MTENNHPITPPPELIEQWLQGHTTNYDLARQAARWGADQELLACGNYLQHCAGWLPEDVTEFYNYRRPRPPSLKEQALRILVENGTTLDGRIELEPEDIPIIRSALEALPND